MRMRTADFRRWKRAVGECKFALDERHRQTARNTRDMSRCAQAPFECRREQVTRFAPSRMSDCADCCLGHTCPL